MVRGKWRLDAPVTLELPDGEVASTWDDIQDALARHHYRQVDEVAQTAINKNDDQILFDIEELELASGSMAHDKAPCHDRISLKIIKEVFRYHSQWCCFPCTISALEILSFHEV